MNGEQAKKRKRCEEEDQQSNERASISAPLPWVGSSKESTFLSQVEEVKRDTRVLSWLNQTPESVDQIALVEWRMQSTFCCSSLKIGPVSLEASPSLGPGTGMSEWNFRFPAREQRTALQQEGSWVSLIKLLAEFQMLTAPHFSSSISPSPASSTDVLSLQLIQGKMGGQIAAWDQMRDSDHLLLKDLISRSSSSVIASATEIDVDDEDQMGWVKEIFSRPFRFVWAQLIFENPVMQTLDVGEVLLLDHDHLASMLRFQERILRHCKSLKVTHVRSFSMESVSYPPSLHDHQMVLRKRDTRHILRDVDQFLSEFSRRIHFHLGRSMIRTYVLHGPPGCGKTSLVRLIASNYRLHILNIEFSDHHLDILQLKSCIARQHGPTLVLFEDVDGFLADSATEDTKRSVGGLAYQDLLNLLDGVDSHYLHPVIFVLTGNTMPPVTSAFFRPGRVDLVVKIHRLPVGCAGRLFRKFAEAWLQSQLDLGPDLVSLDLDTLSQEFQQAFQENKSLSSLPECKSSDSEKQQQKKKQKCSTTKKKKSTKKTTSTSRKTKRQISPASLETFFFRYLHLPPNQWVRKIKTYDFALDEAQRKQCQTKDPHSRDQPTPPSKEVTDYMYL